MNRNFVAVLSFCFDFSDFNLYIWKHRTVVYPAKSIFTLSWSEYCELKVVAGLI